MSERWTKRCPAWRLKLAKWCVGKYGGWVYQRRKSYPRAVVVVPDPQIDIEDQIAEEQKQPPVAAVRQVSGGMAMDPMAEPIEREMGTEGLAMP